MKQMVSIKTTGVTEQYLSHIIDDFTDSLSGLNDKLASVIDESIELSEKKMVLEERTAMINRDLGDQKAVKLMNGRSCWGYHLRMST